MSKSNAATKGSLERIHAKLAEAIDQELDYLIEVGKPNADRENLPANFINAVASFLKQNEITADIRDVDDLSQLREKLQNMRAGNLVKAAEETDYMN